MVALIIASVAAVYAQTLPKTMTIKGEEYTGVFFKERDEVRVKFTHDAGLASVLIADLPPDIQKEFPVDSAKATQQLQDEAKQQNQITRTQAAAATQASLQAAIAKLLSAKPPPGQTSEPGLHIMRVAGKVLQLTPDGALLASDWQNQTLEPFRDGKGIYHGGANIMDEPLLIVGAPANLVDGDEFSGVVYPAGTYAYTSVTGARKTVRRYATSPEMAVRLQMPK